MRALPHRRQRCRRRRRRSGRMTTSAGTRSTGVRPRASARPIRAGRPIFARSSPRAPVRACRENHPIDEIVDLRGAGTQPFQDERPVAVQRTRPLSPPGDERVGRDEARRLPGSQGLERLPAKTRPVVVGREISRPAGGEEVIAANQCDLDRGRDLTGDGRLPDAPWPSIPITRTGPAPCRHATPRTRR